MSEWNLSDPEQRNQAAADYVLGLLVSVDKTRFEALLAVSHEAQQEVQDWREHLHVLDESLQPQTPPARVWKQISGATKSGSLWSSLRLWQGASVSMALAAFLSVTLFLQNPLHENGMDYVYVVQGKGSQPEWIVNASLSQDKVFVEAVQPDRLPDGQACELWLMVAGREPVSLGILPKMGVHEVAIDPSWRSALQNTPLVITLEKPSGARRGYEMGPVLTKGQWTPISKSI